ncbi:MAG TPA: class II aldolase [Gammaproteobacteria bacterium]|nr:class II aldolase [Gammaproteobacteria bacterium]|tara:strand:+ start:1101 stop:1751 length:651 start_codon:yes stop_codon:yes gene_type:complete
MADDEMSLREELVTHYQKVDALGLNEMSSGNLSVRFGDKMLISPNGATGDSITVDNVIACSFDGDYEGDRLPSSEWRMHAAIYEKYEDAGAVVHTHSDYCVAVASHEISLPGFHYLVGVFGGGDVPCVPYSTFGREQLANDASEALAERTACLLGNHGMIARAPNLKRAVNQAQRLEIMCRQYVLARQLGEPNRLTDADWEDFFKKAEEMAYARNG